MLQARIKKREDQLTPLYLSEKLFCMLADALRAYPASSMPRNPPPTASNSLTPAAQKKAADDVGLVMDELVRLGWSSEQARRGVAEGLDGTVDAAIHYLCLHEPEDALPDKFRSHGGALLCFKLSLLRLTKPLCCRTN